MMMAIVDSNLGIYAKELLMKIDSCKQNDVEILMVFSSNLFLQIFQSNREKSIDIVPTQFPLFDLQTFLLPQGSSNLFYSIFYQFSIS